MGSKIHGQSTERIQTFKNQLLKDWSQETQSRDDLSIAACHAEPDAEGTEPESSANVEKQFDESMGRKKREYHLFLEYTEVMR